MWFRRGFTTEARRHGGGLGFSCSASPARKGAFGECWNPASYMTRAPEGWDQLLPWVERSGTRGLKEQAQARLVTVPRIRFKLARPLRPLRGHFPRVRGKRFRRGFTTETQRARRRGDGNLVFRARLRPRGRGSRSTLQSSFVHNPNPGGVGSTVATGGAQRNPWIERASARPAGDCPSNQFQVRSPPSTAARPLPPRAGEAFRGVMRLSVCAVRSVLRSVGGIRVLR